MYCKGRIVIFIINLIILVFFQIEAKSEMINAAKGDKTFRVRNNDKQDSIISFTWNEHRNKVYKDGQKEGVRIFRKGANIIYNRNKTPLLKIKVETPRIVYQAKERKSWGHVQFPRIFRQDSTKIAIVWNMNDDDVTAKYKRGWKYSKDNGNTWFFRWKEKPKNIGVQLSNEEYFKLISKKYEEEDVFETLIPEKQEDQHSFTLYDIRDIDSAYTKLNYVRTLKNGLTQKGSAKVDYLKGTLKHSYKGIFFNQLWGAVKELPDGRLLTCQYPYFYRDGTKIPESGISFFESSDKGKSWRQISFIPFSINEKLTEGRRARKDFVGFSEPIFEVLDNKRIVCVMRSASGYEVAPMYSAISNDLGRTWSRPEPITNNGVSPQLLPLGNGVVVLSYGRPGVQVRFCIPNKDNLEWTDPIELLRYKKLRGQVSCGYTSLFPLSENTFYIVYSDFRTRNDENIPRKGIIIRKITVDKID